MEDLINEMILMHEPEHETVNFSFANQSKSKTNKAKPSYSPPINSPMNIVVDTSSILQQSSNYHQQQPSPLSATSTTSTSTSSSSGFSSQVISSSTNYKQENIPVLENSNFNNNFNETQNKQVSPPQTPQTSRRTSGNSITIRITSESDNNLDDNENRDQEDDTEINDDRDRDRAEDTTSNSTSNENVLNSNHKLGHKHKKSKDKKQFVRSSVQQAHHLANQESEDLIDEVTTIHKHPYQQDNNNNDEEGFFHHQQQNMNKAFDELFAAAEFGDSSISAMIEAKMAADALAQSNHGLENNEFDTEIPFGKKRNSIVRSRNGSFRSSRQSTGSIKKASSKTPPNDDLVLNGNGDADSNTLVKNTFNSSLKTEDYLGSPNNLTRSCSCKRPSSFKRMKSKNNSPNRLLNPNENNGNSPRRSQSRTPTLTAPQSIVNERRGTQCSISILDDLESHMSSNRAGSLPFENLNNFLQNQQLQVFDYDENNKNNTEVYRVRQFNTTNKGSVINRGDSFKRSFKKSSQSISSNKNKKDNSSTVNQDSKNLNLPEFQDGYLNRSSSKCGINETSFIASDANTPISANGIEINGNGFNGLNKTSLQNPAKSSKVASSALNMQVMTYIVFVMGASTVGKNALIKQFKTSEYRGTYDISAHLSQDEDDEGVSVMLDGLESRLQFLSIDTDLSKISSGSFLEITKDNNAFIVVYSISDKASFIIAVDTLKNIRFGENKNQPIILVGNKSDLVRKRSISREEGRSIAIKYGCKFVETSVAINDKVDDLLAGILKQIRLNIEVNSHKESEIAESTNNGKKT